MPFIETSWDRRQEQQEWAYLERYAPTPEEEMEPRRRKGRTLVLLLLSAFVIGVSAMVWQATVDDPASGGTDGAEGASE